MERNLVLNKKIWIYPTMSLPDYLYRQCEAILGISGEDFLEKFKKSKALVITLANRENAPHQEFEHWDSNSEPINPVPEENPLSPAFTGWSNFQVHLTEVKDCYFEN